MPTQPRSVYKSLIKFCGRSHKSKWTIKFTTVCFRIIHIHTGLWIITKRREENEGKKREPGKHMLAAWNNSYSHAVNGNSPTSGVVLGQDIVFVRLCLNIFPFFFWVYYRSASGRVCTCIHCTRWPETERALHRLHAQWWIKKRNIAK